MSRDPFDFDPTPPTAPPRPAEGGSSAWLPVIALLLAALVGFSGWQWHSAREGRRAAEAEKAARLEQKIRDNEHDYNLFKIKTAAAIRAAEDAASVGGDPSAAFHRVLRDDR